MQILIDNKDLKTVYSITCLDYTGALNFAAERTNERVWVDKSGVDKNLENIKFDAKEFVLQCYCKASNIVEAYALVNTLINYMKEKGCFVLSLRDDSKNIRECFICERSDTIVNEVFIREQNSLYRFKLGLKDINPNAVKYKNTVTGGETSFIYDKGQNAVLYWGDGVRGTVSNSGEYERTNFTEDGPIDIVIDVDKDASYVEPLVADFLADVVDGIKPQDVQFTDTSLGTVEIWSWDFGDGNTSAEQNPTHTYTQPGTYTVTLQVFNDAAGSDTEVKINYISIRNARILINNSGNFLLKNDAGNYILKN